MKEELLRLATSEKSALMALNLAREYLQALILQSLQRTSAMTMLAFHGGTALRFLYSLPRYSEDLDFALEKPSQRYDFLTFLKIIRRDLQAQGYTVEIKANDRKTVHSAYIRFAGLPYELHLSPHRDENLAVRIEIDTNPPKGAGLSTALIRRHVILNLQYHDQASLLSGKLHAILQRPYLKGRDLYDLTWYLSDKSWPAPNLVLLNNALAQTSWNGPILSDGNWREVTHIRLRNIPWEQALDDVRPFLPASEDLTFLTRENVLQLLIPNS